MCRIPTRKCFKFPQAVRSERNVWEKVGVQEVKWVQEKQANRSTQGEGDLSKKAWNFPFVSYYTQVHMVPHTVFQFTERKKIIKIKCIHLASERWVLLGDNRQLGSANTRGLFLPPETHLPDEQLQWVPWCCGQPRVGALVVCRCNTLDKAFVFYGFHWHKEVLRTGVICRMWLLWI